MRACPGHEEHDPNCRKCLWRSMDYDEKQVAAWDSGVVCHPSPHPECVICRYHELGKNRGRRDRDVIRRVRRMPPRAG